MSGRWIHHRIIVGNTIFITGTDTGSGKTLLTGLLLARLLEKRGSAAALKPFCAGSLSDVNLFHRLASGRVPKRMINRFYYDEPVAPLVAARRRGGAARMVSVLAHIKAAQRAYDWVLVEGCGGVLVPLGERFMVLDLIRALDCPVILASRNKLGAINHTLLTARVLREAGIRRLKVVLMGSRKADLATEQNVGMIREFLHRTPVLELPYLGPGASRSAEGLKVKAKKFKKTLAQILRIDTF